MVLFKRRIHLLTMASPLIFRFVPAVGQVVRFAATLPRTGNPGQDGFDFDNRADGAEEHHFLTSNEQR